MNVGQRIIALRKEKKISQAQLAQLLGISRQAVSKWENGQSSPDTINLIQLAEVLDTEVEYLATGNKPVYESPPIVVNVVEKVDKYVDRVVEKPIIRKVTRIKYLRNPIEFILCGAVCLIIGIIIGLLL